MSYSNVYQPCDHITFMLTSANRVGTTGKYTFAVPHHYFSNQRGTMCTVQLTAGSYTFRGTTGTDNSKLSCVVHLLSGSANAYTIGGYAHSGDIFNIATETWVRQQRSHDPVIASGTNTASSTTTGCGNLMPAGEFLFAARPDKMEFLVEVLNAENKRVEDIPDKFAGVLNLKFTYYDAVQSAVNLHNHQNYKTL